MGRGVDIYESHLSIEILTIFANRKFSSENNKNNKNLKTYKRNPQNLHKMYKYLLLV